MGFLRRNALPLAAAAFLMVTAGSFAATRGAQEASRFEQEQEISALEERLAELEAERDERGHLAADEVFGTNSARLEADQELIGAVLDTALTWESHAEYEQARAAMVNVYGLPEDSAFMTAFLPQAPFNVDREGNEYALIDLLGLDSQVSDFRSLLMTVHGTEYSYLVFVDVRTTSDDGEGGANSTSTVLLTTDGDGGVTEVEGYAATSPMRQSGPN
ncbi:hypothetical protein ABZ635_04245 [Nocardiopsis sp. NPDC007018]|uniref:hypothetical protein n=1 Tax=Nocardiopsis sp. NPDC007018 TaxID=3155721 RepID=UPI003401D427